MAARPIGNARYALLNNRLSVYGPDGVRRRIARSAPELASFLTEFFDIRAPGVSDELLEDVFKRSS
jgi:hypothetical protein